jgi:hypothetical protein
MSLQLETLPEPFRLVPWPKAAPALMTSLYMSLQLETVLRALGTCGPGPSSERTPS